MAAGNFAASMGSLVATPNLVCLSKIAHLSGSVGARRRRSDEQADIWQPAASLSQLELHNDILFPAAAILGALWLVVGDKQQACILH